MLGAGVGLPQLSLWNRKGRPALDLFFAEQGRTTLDPRITFSRTTNATVTGSNGLVQYAPHNLLTFSEQFDNATWSKTNITVAANSSVAPDGTTTADTLTATATASTFVIRDTVISGTSACLSYYIKPNNIVDATTTFLMQDLTASVTKVTATVTWSNMSVSGAGASISAVGNGWYRLVLASSALVSGNTIRTWINTGSTVSAGQSFYLWGAQLELGSTATTYNPTTVKNLLGFTEHFDNAAWTKSNAFVQTNLLLQSQNFDNAAWGKVGGTVTANYATAPDGTSTATLVNVTSTSELYQEKPFTSGSLGTFSVWVKAAATSSAQRARITTTNAAAWNTGVSQVITLTDQWQRVVLSGILISSGTTVSAEITSFDASKTSDSTCVGNVLIWGAQLVQGTTPGDYKATYAAAAAVGYTDIYGQPFAQKLVETTALAQHAAFASLTLAAAPYTFSVYAKQAEGSQRWLNLFPQGTGVSASAIFDVTNGTVTATSGAQYLGSAITATGNGWYRCSITFTAAAVSVSNVAYLANSSTIPAPGYTGDGTSGIYIFGAQLSDSASVDPYVYQPVAAPTSTAYYGPRFDYDPVTLAPKGLLIEEQRTNLVTYSEQLDNAVWFRQGGSITANSSISPNGTVDADRLTESAAGSEHYTSQQITKAASSITYTHSAYFKNAAGTRNFGIAITDGTTGGYGAIFSTSGSIVSSSFPIGGTGAASWTFVSSSIASVGNGWYRASVTVTSNTATRLDGVYYLMSGTTTIYTGDGASGLFLWGAQLEAGSGATSYTPTVASQVTRAADNASMIGNNFARWYNQTAGTALVKYDFAALGSRTALEFSDGTVNNRMRYASDITYTGTQVITGGAAQATLIPAISVANTPYALSGSYAPNSFIAVDTNDIADVDTSGTVPVPSQLRLGNDVSNNYLNGHVAGLTYFNRALSVVEQTSLVNGVYTLSVPSLFANGEQGWWFDPSNSATLFQDSAGTTPVTAVEQPVGLQLDLSKGLVLGSELVTNAADRNFTSNTGYWTLEDANWNISGNALNKTASSLSSCTHNGVLTTGVGFSVTITIASISGGILYVNQGTAFGAAITAPGTYTFPFIATGARIGFTSGLGAVFSITNVSYKPLAGNHRFQSTSANRPVVSARVNLLTKTEQFDDAVWTKGSVTITANAIVAPDGTTTADKLIGTAATDQKIVKPASLTAAAGVYKLSCYMKVGEFSFAGLSLYDGTSYFASAGFNLSTGTVTSTFGGSAAIEPAENGWYLCSVTGTAVGAIQAQFSGIRLYSSAPAGVTSNCVGDGTSGIFIWGADLRVTNQGVGLPAYQRVNTSTDYDSTGFPIYIKPNGSNQFMQTNSINFSATDKMTVWQGVRKLTNTAAIFTELGTGTSSNEFFLAVNAISNDYWVSLGADGAFTSGSYASPLTNVLTAIYDLAGATADDEKKLRINGVQILFASNSGTNTGNFINAAAYFYMRAGNSFIFNGNDYGSIARGAASTAAQITNGETYINSLTKAY